VFHLTSYEWRSLLSPLEESANEQVGFRGMPP
jgi:hypothetical protein